MPTEEDADLQATVLEVVHKVTSRQRRQRRPKSPAVLGKARVTKPSPKYRDMRIRTVRSPRVQNATTEPDFTTQSNIQQIPMRRETKPRRAKGDLLSQLHPQGVSKTKRFADDGKHPRPGSTTRLADPARPQRRSARHRQHSASGTVQTRSGRSPGRQ